MTKNKLGKFLSVEIFNFLRPRGFGSNAISNEFVRKTNSGIDKCSYYIAGKGGGNFVTFGLNIRINLVENLIFPFLNIDQKYKDGHTTSLVSIGKLINEPGFRYQVKTNEDANTLLAHFKKIMQDQGELYYKKYENNIGQFDKDLNSNINVETIHMDETYRPHYGILFAKLNNNTDYNNLVTEYSKKLKGKVAEDNFYEKSLELFNDEVKFLDNYKDGQHA